MSVLHQAVFTSSWPGRGHRGYGQKFPAGYFPCCASPAGAVSMVLAALVAPQGQRTSWAHLEQQARYPFPSLRMSGGVSCHAAGRFHRGGGFSFSLCSRSPWRARQKPLIAGIACNGAACHTVVIPPNDSGKRPVAYLLAGRHFFSRSPICQTAPPESRPTSSPAWPPLPPLAGRSGVGSREYRELKEAYHAEQARSSALAARLQEAMARFESGQEWPRELFTGYSLVATAYRKGQR